MKEQYIQSSDKFMDSKVYEILSITIILILYIISIIPKARKKFGNLIKTRTFVSVSNIKNFIKGILFSLVKNARFSSKMKYQSKICSFSLFL